VQASARRERDTHPLPVFLEIRVYVADGVHLGVQSRMTVCHHRCPDSARGSRLPLWGLADDDECDCPNVGSLLMMSVIALWGLDADDECDCLAIGSTNVDCVSAHAVSAQQLMTSSYHTVTATSTCMHHLNTLQQSHAAAHPH